MRSAKQRQAEHPKLTLTQMYNVLEKLKAMEARGRHPPPSSPGVSRPSTSPQPAAQQRRGSPGRARG